MRGHLQFFADTGAAITLSPAPFDHAKLMTVDDAWCLVGSSNWDARSLRLNFEFDVECYDHALTARIDTLIDARIARSRPLRYEDLLARPKWQLLRNAGARLFLPYL
jgi:cardiolipin synthase